MDNVQETLYDFGEKVTLRAKANLNRGRGIATGNLRSSLRWRVIKTSKGYELGFYMADYGPEVDAGRDGTKKKQRTGRSVLLKQSNKGSNPPVSALIPWTAQKRINPSGTTTSRESLAFAISLSIEKKGIKPTMFFSAPFSKNYPNLADDIAKAVGEDVISNINIKLKAL